MKSPVQFSPHCDNPQEWRTGDAREVTESGLFIACNSLWPPQTRLTLVLTMPGKRLPVRVSGQVVWARTAGTAGMFVTFVAERAAEQPTREEAAANGGAPGAADVRKPTLES